MRSPSRHPLYPEKNVSAKAAYARASERLNEVVDALDRPLDHSTTNEQNAPPVAAFHFQYQPAGVWRDGQSSEGIHRSG